MLEEGALSIGRKKENNNMFNRNPVDMTLEEIINADAASKFTGIGSFSGNQPALRRWMITKSAHTQIVESFMSMTGTNKRSTSQNQELSKSRIERDNNDLQSIMIAIKDSLNPFSITGDNLLCLKNGCPTSEEVKKEALSFRQIGEKWYDEISSQCLEKSERFEQPIKRRKVKCFSSEAIKVNISVKYKKIKQISGTKDLFGRLLYLATVMKIDLQHVFCFPLTPVPLSLADVTGSKHKATKSKLLAHLEAKVAKVLIKPKYDVYIVDAMLTVRPVTPRPLTYAAVAKAVLKLITYAPIVYFVCDEYRNPSIKDHRSKPTVYCRLCKCIVQLCF